MSERGQGSSAQRNERKQRRRALEPGELWTLHLWEVQPIRDVLVIVGIIGLIWLGYALRIVTAPLLLALALAYLFEPIVCRLTASRMINRPGAALMIIAAFLLFVVIPSIVGIGYAVVEGGAYASRMGSNLVMLNRSVQDPEEEELREALPSDSWRYIRDAIVDWHEERLGPTPEEGDELVPLEPGEDEVVLRNQASARAEFIALMVNRAANWVEQNTESLGRQALQTGAGAVGVAMRAVVTVGMLVFGAFLTAFFFYFLCTGYGRVIVFWEGLVPEKRKGRVFELAAKMDRVIAGFIRGRLTVCAVQVVYFTAAYWAIGVPAPFIVGPIVGVLCIVPYLGLVSLPLTIGLMALDPIPGVRGQWWWVLAAPAVVYFIGQAIDDYILTPIIQGKSTGMDTPTILFASIAGGAMAGIYGLLLAIPIAACLKILMTDVFWPHFYRWTEGKEPDVLPIAQRPGEEG